MSAGISEANDGVPSGVGDGSVAEAREGRLAELVILVGASLYAPLIVWSNSSERAGILGFALLGLGILLVALVARFGMTRAGLDARGSTYAVSVLVFASTNGGVLLDRGFPRAVLIGGTLALTAVSYYLRRSNVFGMAILWGGLFLLGYPWLLWITSSTDPSERTVADPDPLEAALTSESRDIVLIALDGYANSVVLSEMYGFDTSGFDSELDHLGFDVSSRTLANYGRTRMSVSGVLQLGHPIGNGEFNSADFEHLLSIVGGDNVLANWLDTHGYVHTYVESGWFGTRCGSTVDICIEGPWPNESLYDVTNRSLIKDLPGFETGRSFSRGARKVLGWLATDLESLLTNGHPDFIYAHVLLPHPPLFHDSNCDFRPQDGVKGFTIARPGMTEDELQTARDWYGMQVACVNRHLLEVARIAEEHDAVTVMFGDHGPDSLGQLYVPGSEWSEEQRRERFSAMLAVRIPGCEVPPIESLVNVGRRLVSCISDVTLPDLPSQTFETEPAPGGQRLVEVPVPEYGADS